MGKGERKRGFVPASSVEAYGRVLADSRTHRVLDWLGRYGATHAGWPTSAELLRWAEPSMTHSLARLLFVRRGLSDAQKLGVVEHAGKRPCTVAKTLAVTWKVKSR